MTDRAYETILAAARERFAVEPYREVTIRAIAADAGYSPAMVMKLMDSKENLFWLVAPGIAAEGLNEERELLPQSEIGHELVRRIFARRRSDSGDPYALAPLLIRSAPEQSGIREVVRQRYLRNMSAMIGDTTADLRHAKAVISMLLGIAASVHILDVYDNEQDAEAIKTFGGLVQNIVDRCDGPRLPLPDESVGINAGDRGLRFRA